jgi:hypothetical protein
MKTKILFVNGEDVECRLIKIGNLEAGDIVTHKSIPFLRDVIGQKCKAIGYPISADARKGGQGDIYRRIKPIKSLKKVQEAVKKISVDRWAIVRRDNLASGIDSILYGTRKAARSWVSNKRIYRVVPVTITLREGK